MTTHHDPIFYRLTSEASPETFDIPKSNLSAIAKGLESFYSNTGIRSTWYGASVYTYKSEIHPEFIGIARHHRLVNVIIYYLIYLTT